MISLRVRLLLPILAAAVVSAVVVTAGSYALGDRLVQQEADRRFRSVAETVGPASFPLTDSVLRTLARLSGTHLVALAGDGSVVRWTLDGTPHDPPHLLRQQVAQALGRWSATATEIVVEKRRFHVRMVSRRPGGASTPAITRVAVLFDHGTMQAARLRAAAFPLLTGLSTTFALTAVTLLLTGRLVSRLSRLQQRVERIAKGEFAAVARPANDRRAVDAGPLHAASAGPLVSDGVLASTGSGEVADEVAALGDAVDAMAAELQQLWRTVQQQEREKLLHQMAAGLAHQLRNSLTGARIALDLHASRCNQGLDEGLQVAVGELERIEEDVRRILLIAAGRQHPDAPGSVAQCLGDVQHSLAPVARHLGFSWHWQVDPHAAQWDIADAPTLGMAVSNLVLNALQAQGQRVDVTATIVDRQLTISVADDGPGPPPELGERLFDPFISSKPEGLGLGLPLVRRAAEKLGGTVSWRRETIVTAATAGSTSAGERTVFAFQVPILFAGRKSR